MIFTNTALFSTRQNTSSLLEKEETGDVCIANISPRERQKRMRFGIIQFVITVIVLAVLVVLDVNPLWRLPLFFMFGAAAAGYFQAKDKT